MPGVFWEPILPYFEQEGLKSLNSRDFSGEHSIWDIKK